MPEQILEALLVQIVGAAFDAHDLLGDGVEARCVGADLAEQRDRLRDQPGSLDDDAAHLAHQRVERLHLEQFHRLDGLVHHIDRVIHRLDQILDVAAIEGGDEGAPDRKQDLGGDAVGLVFEIDDRLAPAVDVLAAEKMLKGFGAADHGARMPLEQIEEAILARQQLAKPAQHLFLLASAYPT
jgi:hypothetical protein